MPSQTYTGDTDLTTGTVPFPNQESPVTTSQLDLQPHVLVIYSPKNDDDEGGPFPANITRFPNHAAAKALGEFLSNYSGVEFDVFPLQEPANDVVTKTVVSLYYSG